MNNNNPFPPNPLVCAGSVPDTLDNCLKVLRFVETLRPHSTDEKDLLGLHLILMTVGGSVEWCRDMTAAERALAAEQVRR